jgi:hypothetical protein
LCRSIVWKSFHPHLFIAGAFGIVTIANKLWPGFRDLQFWRCTFVANGCAALVGKPNTA